MTRRSGKGRLHVSMRRGCNRRLQAALYAAARASVRTSRWAAAYWKAARSRGVPTSVVARTLSNKWVKILWALFQTGELYDDARHVRRLLERRVPWALTLEEVAA